MRLELTGRHLTVTPDMRREVQQRLAHLERLLSHSAVSAQVVVTREKFRCHVEITVHARGEHFLHAEAAGRDWGTGLIAAADKIERQAQRLNGKWKERKRRGISPAKAASSAPQPERGGRGFGERRAGRDESAEREVRIVRARRYAVKPMSIDEAALEMGDGRAAFLVFRNASNDAVTVLYRRPDGHLGLIEPEA